MKCTTFYTTDEVFRPLEKFLTGLSPEKIFTSKEVSDELGISYHAARLALLIFLDEGILRRRILRGTVLAFSVNPRADPDELDQEDEEEGEEDDL